MSYSPEIAVKISASHSKSGDFRGPTRILPESSEPLEPTLREKLNDADPDTSVSAGLAIKEIKAALGVLK